MKENKKLKSVFINDIRIYVGDHIKYKNELTGNIYLATVNDIFMCNDDSIFLGLISEDYKDKYRPLQIHIDSFSNDISHRNGNRTIIEVSHDGCKHNLQDSNSAIISYY